MLKSVKANNSKFKPVIFKKGLNVIIAEKSHKSSDEDTRNGVGKTSIIEIIHFCLGGEAKKGLSFNKKELAGWSFTIDLEINEKNLSICREISDASKFYILEDSGQIFSNFKEDNGKKYVSEKQINTALGELIYNIPKSSQKYSPSFRMLFSYSARKGIEAYSSPFKYFPNQQPWQIQVCNTYLMGLSSEYASELQTIKDEKKILKELKKSLQSGILSRFIGDLGELESIKINLMTEVNNLDNQINTFKVHPQYEEIETRVNELTKNIHDLSNKNVTDRLLLSNYSDAIKLEKKNINISDIETMYEEVNIIFPDLIKKRISDIKNFHSSVVKNRNLYLRDEIKILEKSILERNVRIKEITEERAKYFTILKNHGALAEYNSLSERFVMKKNELEEIKSKINDLKKIKHGESEIRIRQEQLNLKIGRDYEERQLQRDKLINIFSQNTRSLYEKPGQLVLNYKESGYDFNIEIERSSSSGIKFMEILCYDLLIAEVNSENKSGPMFLIHDSTIFADVDERQILKAIQLAKNKSLEHNFQYICCMNSDKMPEGLKSGDSSILQDIVLELKDYPEEAGLFGFRF
ncbi:DUF2326 domain-containing protein [Pigmentibacter sp. JX0631]|uniref:DUF2326 domain-containing protein n=1 Tax=Pigmentibacter sp. JX0631 TaxID=2976982 RepID=UPI002469B6B7|nr:DUF2326 domain-containing protein [Pigmentibacter sp. JX0631]WGL59756.1 DUF2326 domain-containing protein [Pigmentibacter sp. JX0631]